MKHPSHLPAPAPLDHLDALSETQAFWEEWSTRSTYDGEWKEAVDRSLVTLKALTYEPTARRLVGNFPQAFTHLALVDSAHGLSREPRAGERPVASGVSS